MENASQALLMAAGVLIGIMVLSLAVYLIVDFGSTSAQVHEQNRINQINQFNAQFTSYEGKNCTIYDIVTVVNLAIDNNKNYDLSTQDENNYYIRVIGNGGGLGSPPGNLEIAWKNPTAVNDAIKENSKLDFKYENSSGEIEEKQMKRYNCIVSINQNTKRVNVITFTPQSTAS